MDLASSLGMSDRWLELGEAIYFLPNNHTRRWSVEFHVDHDNRKNSWRVTMDGEEYHFPTLDEAKAFVENTYALTAP